MKHNPIFIDKNPRISEGAPRVHRGNFQEFWHKKRFMIRFFLSRTQVSRLKRLLPFKKKTVKAQIGNLGEKVAARFLKKEKGFKILERNWRSGRDWRYEIDIIGRDGGVLVFVEVRTRKEESLLPGFYSVTARKKRTLKRACKDYLKQTPSSPKHYRFDIVEVKHCKDGKNKVNHYINILLFSKHTYIRSHSND